MNHLVEHAWMIWILVAVVAALLELLLPYFTFSFVAAGAAIAALSSVWLSMPIQLVVFSASLVGLLFLVRPKLIKRFHVPHKMHSRSGQLLHLKGTVTESIDKTKASGRVFVNGEDWSAQADLVIAAGQTVEVIGSDGIVLIVREV